jgi:hypothetical protein
MEQMVMDAHADKPRATSMTLIRRIILAFALMARLDPAIALAPPPVPSLLDAPRIAQYTIASSNCNCPVGFALYGDGTAVDNWIQVLVGTQPVLSTDLTFGWSLSTPAGPLGSIPRPITTAVLTFNSLQSGNITILDARRPLPTSQFQENRGVVTRDLNQAITDEIAMLREDRDHGLHSIQGPPGEQMKLLPPAATRAGQALTFDGRVDPVVSTPSTLVPEVISAESYSVFHDFVHDDAPAIQAALNAASAAGGGWVRLNPSQPYWAQTQITIPAGVTLGCAAPPEKQHASGNTNYTNDGCAIYLAPNNPLTNNGNLINARVYQDNIHFAGQPATVHALKAITLNFANTGTGIINGAFDAIIQDVSVAGFNLGISDTSTNRGSLRHVLIEAQNCVKTSGIGDYLKWVDIECWPFYSATRDFYHVGVTAVANNGSGLWRLTLASAPAEACVNGDEYWVGGNGTVQFPQGALGRHIITCVDSTHVDESDAPVNPNPTGNTTLNNLYVTGLSSMNGLFVGETFTGSCFSGTRTVTALMPTENAILSDAAATSTTTGCSLTFTSPTAFNAGSGTPLLMFDGSGGQHGIGVEFGFGGIQASNVFVWGHDIGFQFDSGGSTVQMTAASVDFTGGYFARDRIGILFQNGSAWNKVTGVSFTSGGVAVVNKSAAAQVNANIVELGRINGWKDGAIQNLTAGLIVSGGSDGDVFPAGLGTIFNLGNSQLAVVNGSLFPASGALLTDSGGTGQIVIDPGSQVGAYIVKNQNLICTNSPAICTSFNSIVTGGQPSLSSCSVTGAGTGATCSPATGSSISNFGFFITTGTSPTSSGTVTANFGTSFTGTLPTCVAVLDDTNSAWSAAALPPHATAISNSSVTFSWNNNGRNLTPSFNYRIGVLCLGK